MLPQIAHGRLERWRRRFPNATCRVRNLLELGPWYLARWNRGHRGGAAEAYDAQFWDLHDSGDWRGFAACVMDHFPDTRSIVDVGCGQGSALAGFASLGGGLALRGFDDSSTAIARARSRGLTVEPLDVVALSVVRANAYARALGPVDLAICLEVAEHLPAWHAGKLLDVLTCARRLVFSAAHPNQGGTLHVNERPASHWIGRLASRGFHLARQDGAFRDAVARLSLAPWYAENVHVFEAEPRG
jgi:2-polyprenyl-3-methyl-5-hydroxy-6-metoxy-1,4-benzoquinol methylase